MCNKESDTSQPIYMYTEHCTLNASRSVCYLWAPSGTCDTAHINLYMLKPNHKQNELLALIMVHKRYFGFSASQMELPYKELSSTSNVQTFSFFSHSALTSHLVWVPLVLNQQRKHLLSRFHILCSSIPFLECYLRSTFQSKGLQGVSCIWECWRCRGWQSLVPQSVWSS